MPSGGASRDAAIQSIPAAPKDARPRTWRPMIAKETSGEPVFYRFAAASLPSGDLQIVIATDGGDERFTIRAQDRTSIR